MNILFLTLSKNINPNDKKSIYSSILYELINAGNKLYIVSPEEKRNNKNTYIEKYDNYQVLHVKIDNITKTNKIEKGISTLLIEKQYKSAIKRYFKNLKFDLVLYATPPITFCNVIQFIKKRDNAKTYLMLKDIFPQNAVDLNMFKKYGPIYTFFRYKEKKLYKISDRIGCMSLKNKRYLLNNNKYLNENKIEIFPNSISVDKDEKISKEELKKYYREKYKIRKDQKVFLYGGSLGKPQAIDFIISSLDKINKINNCFFIICGTGTEYKKLKEKINNSNYQNILLINGLPKQEYDKFISIADVGMIFLDYRFTIPNFPSRLLSYLENEIPVLSCTDKNTDIGDIIEENNFGWKCYSNDVNKFILQIKKIIKSKDLKKYGKNGKIYLEKNYNSKINCNKIIKFLSKK